MRNLKKFLALVLAMMMVFGLMVTVNAADEDDAVTSTAAEQYDTAVEVAKALKILIGNDDGDYDLEGEFTRAHFATVLYRLISGDTVVDDDNFPTSNTYLLYASMDAQFDDTVGHWANGFINYAVAKNLLKGYGDGNFGPDRPVTMPEMLVVLLRALGKDDGTIGGNSWEQMTLNLAIEEKLVTNIDKDLYYSDANRAMAAQVILNAMVDAVPEIAKTGTYHFVATGKAGQVVPAGIQTLIDNEAVYTSLESALTLAAQLDTELKNLGKDKGYEVKEIIDESKTLKGLHKLNVEQTVNAEGVPVVKYSVGTTEIKTINDETVGAPQTATVIDTGKTVKDAVGTASGGYELYVNGVPTTGDGTYATKVGDFITYYIDADKHAIVSINRVDGVAKLSSAPRTNSSGKVSITDLGISTEDAKNVPGYETLEKGDVVYWWKDNAKVYHITVATPFEGVLSKVSGNNPTLYTINGDVKRANGNAADASVTSKLGDSNGTRFKDTYNYYTDANGFLIYVDEIDNSSTSDGKDYVVITDMTYVKGDGSYEASKYFQAKILHMNTGKTEIVKVNSVKLGYGNTTNATTYKGTQADTTWGTANAGNSYTLKMYSTDGEGTWNPAVVGAWNTKFFTCKANTDGTVNLTEAVNEANTAIITMADIGSSTSANLVINNGATSIADKTTPSTRVILNNNTVFVLPTPDELGNFDGEFETYDRHVGRTAIPNITVEPTDATPSDIATMIYYVKDDNGAATYVYIPNYATATTSANQNAESEDTVLILEAVAVNVVSTSDGTTGQFPAIVNGTAFKMITVEQNDNDTWYGGLAANVATNTVYKVTYADDGETIAKLTAVADASGAANAKNQFAAKTSATGYTLAGGVLMVGSATYACADDVQVFIITTSGTPKRVTSAPATDIIDRASDKNDDVIVIYDTDTSANKIAKYVVLVENKDDVTSAKFSDVLAGTTAGSEATGGEATGGNATSGDLAPVEGYDDGTAVKAEQTIEVVVGTKIVKFTVTADGKGSKVQYRAGTGTSFNTFTDVAWTPSIAASATNSRTIEVDVTGLTANKSKTVQVKVTSVDGSESVYTIIVKVVAATPAA